VLPLRSDIVASWPPLSTARETGWKCSHPPKLSAIPHLVLESCM